jgi:hypothetical protein
MVIIKCTCRSNKRNLTCSVGSKCDSVCVVQSRVTLADFVNVVFFKLFKVHSFYMCPYVAHIFAVPISVSCV